MGREMGERFKSAGIKKKKKCRDLEEQPHVQGAVAAWAQEG